MLRMKKSNSISDTIVDVILESIFKHVPYPIPGINNKLKGYLRKNVLFHLYLVPVYISPSDIYVKIQLEQ